MFIFVWDMEVVWAVACIIKEGRWQLLRPYCRQSHVNNEQLKGIIYYDLEKSIGIEQKDLSNLY